MTKVKMYPSSIQQPNQNTSNGTEGKFSKEIKRNGKIGVEKLNERDLKDPKYYHLWKNTSNLKSGGVANCGNRSSYHCNHKTYYSIKGYRNTCPIAGATGTYTQPAKLRLGFSPSSKGIVNTDKIKSVKISFQHRCVGVDVANNKTYTSWGPNFSGFNHYSNKVLSVKIAGQTQYWNNNPPLSDTKYDTVTLTFKSTSSHPIKYNDIDGPIDIQYGNNLSTNPGNIYIKNLTIEVEYESGKKYIEASQTSASLYTSEEESCVSEVTFTLEAGYKNGQAKISPSKAPEKFQDKKLTVVPPSGTNSNTWKWTKIIPTPKDGKTIKIKVKDITNIAGKKEFTCKLDGAGEHTFKYTATKRTKPTITIPAKIEKNTAPKGITSITARDGCTSSIIAYDNNINTPIYTFTNLNLNNNSNMISQTDIDNFYRVLSGLSCGIHKIIFKRGNETIDTMPVSYIEITPTQYQIDFYEINDDGESKILEKTIYDQDKLQNKKIKIVYVKTKDLLTNPVFSIVNPTYGLNNTPSRVNSNPISFTPDKEGGSIEVTIGTYFPGDYRIRVREPENCSERESNITITINPKHKQHFDEIFVRGEDSTAFDYDYLVALEGDTIQEPLYISEIGLGASYKDIKICSVQDTITTINKPEYIPVTITNTSDNDINELFIELNALYENEDGDLEVSTDEWINEDGIFYNFANKFNDYNKDLSNVVSIKNLSPDEDDIYEEDVYIHVKKLYSKQSIEIAIPIFSFSEKEVYLQMLLFGEPIALYNKNDCTKEEIRFELMKIQVVDAILNDMKIIGDMDILVPEIIDCPLECFKTEGITYYIKNIDSSEAESPKTVITNDPRLIPYKIEDKNGNEIRFELDNLTEEEIDSMIEEGEGMDPTSLRVLYSNTTQNREFNLIGTPVKITFDFNDETISYTPVSSIETNPSEINSAKEEFKNEMQYEKVTLKGHTDSSGYVTLYITIPKNKGKNYTVKDLKKICSINIDYPGASYTLISNPTVYKPGQAVPFKIKVTSTETIYLNQITFNPNITYPGSYDQITVYYKICNLKNNEGILHTKFETNYYKLLKNVVEEDILCGVPTSLDVSAQLTEVIVEQTHYNRLYIDIKNKNRFNKDIKIHIKEKENNLKYHYFDHNIEEGELEFGDKEIIWKIDYLDRNTRTKGYIDFRGDILGISKIEVSAEDFAKDIEFNKEYCECPRNN